VAPCMVGVVVAYHLIVKSGPLSKSLVYSLIAALVLSCGRASHREAAAEAEVLPEVVSQLPESRKRLEIREVNIPRDQIPTVNHQAGHQAEHQGVVPGPVEPEGEVNLSENESVLESLGFSNGAKSAATTSAHLYMSCVGSSADAQKLGASGIALVGSGRVRFWRGSDRRLSESKPAALTCQTQGNIELSPNVRILSIGEMVTINVLTTPKSLITESADADSVQVQFICGSLGLGVPVEAHGVVVLDNSTTLSVFIDYGPQKTQGYRLVNIRCSGAKDPTNVQKLESHRSIISEP
jgi:hypothetical protein